MSTHLAYVELTTNVEQAASGFLNQITEAVTRYGGGIRGVSFTVDDLLASPVVAIATVDDVCEKLIRVREELGFTYFVAPYGTPPDQLARTSPRPRSS